MKHVFYYTAEKKGRRTGAGHQRYAVRLYAVRMQQDGTPKLENINDGTFMTGGLSLRQYLRALAVSACNYVPAGYTGMPYESILASDSVELIPLGDAPENA